MKNSTFEKSDPYKENDNTLIIEFTRIEDGSLQPVSIIPLLDRKKLKERSNLAMDRAIDIIQTISNKVNSKIKENKDSPDNIEIEFGIKFDAEIGIILVKSTLESSLNIKLKWSNFKNS